MTTITVKSGYDPTVAISVKSGYSPTVTIAEYTNYLDYVRAVNSSNLKGLWPMNERSGTSALELSGSGAGNGTYSLSFTVGGSTFLDGNPSILWPGYVLLNKTTLDPLLYWNHYTLNMWILPTGTFWTNGLTNTLLALYSVGTTQRIEIRKGATNGVLAFITGTGSTLKQVGVSAKYSLAWTMLTITNDKTNDQMKAYINGVQVGTTQTGLGTDDASALNYSIIGDADGDWTGSTAYCALWTGTTAASVLSAAEILAMYNHIGRSNYGWVQTGDSMMTSEAFETPLLAALEISTNHPWFNLAELAEAGISVAGWKDGQYDWLGIDAELAAVSVTQSPDYVLVNVGKNDVGSPPEAVAWNANYTYCLAAIHTKWPNAYIILEQPWRGDGDYDAGCLTISARIQAIATSLDYVLIGPDENVYFKPNVATYSDDNVHINTTAGGAARAAQLQSIMGY